MVVARDKYLFVAYITIQQNLHKFSDRRLCVEIRKIDDTNV